MEARFKCTTLSEGSAKEDRKSEDYWTSKLSGVDDSSSKYLHGHQIKSWTIIAFLSITHVLIINSLIQD
jgi:hypothetical protein